LGIPKEVEGIVEKRFLLIMMFFSRPRWCKHQKPQLKGRNRLFWKGNYQEALKKYNDALIDAPFQHSAL